MLKEGKEDENATLGQRPRCSESSQSGGWDRAKVALESMWLAAGK